jgi:NADH-quinone oxidoreductase subunit N
MGYSFIALSTGNYSGVEASMFYTSVYMLSSLCAWSVLLCLRIKNNKVSYKYSKELGDLSGLCITHKGFSFTFAVSMLSLAGLPPLIGFVSKWIVFLILMNNHLFFSIIISLVCSVISTFYYIRIIKVIYFENILISKLYYPIKTKNVLLLTCLIFILIFLFFNPTVLYTIIHSIVLNLLNGFLFFQKGNLPEQQVFVYPLYYLVTSDTLTNLIELHNT